jgi:hypothetical protein
VEQGSNDIGQFAVLETSFCVSAKFDLQALECEDVATVPERLPH